MREQKTTIRCDRCSEVLNSGVLLVSVVIRAQPLYSQGCISKDLDYCHLCKNIETVADIIEKCTLK